VLVKVTADEHVGWGEATPIPSWTYETLESIASTIDRYLAPAAIGTPVWDCDRLTRAVDRTINGGSIGMPLAKGAVDVAVYDLLGKALGLPVYALLGG
jgi:muconate cycloisomerase